MSEMKFITQPSPKVDLTTLSLHDNKNGVVELWGYGQDDSDGYRIGHFTGGILVLSSLSSRAQKRLHLQTTDKGHIVTKLQ